MPLTMHNLAQSYTIVPIQQLELPQVLEALNLVLGPGHDQSWFNWKHVTNPFGTSEGWVAIDQDGILGLRLMMRWVLQIGNRTIRSVRPVDTITVPRARNRGVFRSLTLFALESLTRNLQPEIIFNTPNANSRSGYEKMGWTLLPSIAHAFHILAPGRKAAIEHTRKALDAWDHFAYPHNLFTTQRKRNVLEWRYDSRSGMDYRIARLQSSDEPNGIVYRIVNRKGIRVLVLCELLGSEAERKILVRTAARNEGALLILCTTGEGSLPLMTGPALRRGQSILAVRPCEPLPSDPVLLHSWGLTLGDMERVI